VGLSVRPLWIYFVCELNNANSSRPECFSTTVLSGRILHDSLNNAITQGSVATYLMCGGYQMRIYCTFTIVIY